MEFHAKCTVFGEGCRGHLTKFLSKKLDLRKDCQPMTFAIGLKELWEIPAEKHQRGYIEHNLGWPLVGFSLITFEYRNLKNNRVK